MKNKGLLITAILFLLLVSTTSYWQGKLGILLFPVFTISGLIYIALIIATLRQLFFAVKEKFTDKQRNISLVILTAALALTFFRPFGLLDTESLGVKNLLIARKEGTGNCHLILKLKEDHTFTERDVCISDSEVRGKYTLSNDTVYFEYLAFDENRKEFYQFAVIRPALPDEDGKQFELARFKDQNDTTGNILPIALNELYKP